MKVELIITRKVIFEKSNIKHEMKDFFLSFIDGCELKLSEKYPGSIFYMKNDIILFLQETKSKTFWIRYDLIWSVFENKYGFSYSKIQAFLKHMLGTNIKLNGYTPNTCNSVNGIELETNVKLEGYTPQLITTLDNPLLKKHMKLKGYILVDVFNSVLKKFETHLKSEGYTPISNLI